MAELAESVEPPVKPASRSFRIWYCVIQTVALAVFAVLCRICAKFETIYSELGMTKLPPLTELWLGIAPFFRSFAGLLLLAVIGAALVALGMRGTLDRILRNLIAANVIGTFLLVGFYVLALFVPIMHIQEALREK